METQVMPTPEVAQQNLDTLTMVRGSLPLAGSIVGVIVARRMYGLKFWGSVGVWIAVGAVVAAVVYAATQKKWNYNISAGAVSPFEQKQ